jgi:hypothetical protein
MLCLFGGYVALTSDPTVARLRLRFFHSQDLSPLHSVGAVLLVLAAFLLAFAVYSQLRFGPSIRSVRTPAMICPPHGFRAWFGVVVFALVILLMAAVVFVHFVFTLIKT